MVYIIIAALVLMILISLFFAKREQPKIAYNRMRKSDDETLSRLITDVCRRMKLTDGGKGINPTFLMGSIRRANAMIADKVKNNVPLSEGEKWFYENFYLVYRYVYTRKDNLKTLPHIDNVPRVVAITKLIVNNSLDSLTVEHVQSIMESVKSTVNLTFAELKEFNNALNYAVLEQVYILSKRLLKQEFYKKAAYRKRFSENYLKSDVYVYYLYHINLMGDEEKIKLAKRGFNAKTALINYNNITMHNALMAKTLFGTLREADTFLPVHIGLKYLASYQTLSKYTDLEKIHLNTRLDYFASLESVCQKNRIDEGYAAEKLIEMAEDNSVDVSDILFDHKSAFAAFLRKGKKIRIRKEVSLLLQRLYCSSVILTSLAVCTIIAVFFDIAAGVLALIPTFFIVENILNYLLAHTVKGINTPKLCFKNVPYRHNVMVAVSEFISSKEQFEDSLKHLAEINASNGGENVQVALLVDLKGGDSASGPLDEEIKEFLSNEKLDGGLNVFIRKKEKINGKYQGKERKRGAINALNKLLVTRNEEEFDYIYDRNFVTPEYVITLDADNELMPNEVTEMVNMMAHPYNNRFDMLACHSKYNLFSVKTRYATRFLPESGTEMYPTFSGLYFNLFRREIFCGKGIYRLNAFYNKLEGIFPSGKILSHDIIEGSVLTTGSGATVFEDAPTGFLSDRERRKRWQRGDIQLLPFMNGKWKNDEGKKCKTDIEPLNKFTMGKNILGNLKELCIFTILMLGLFLNVNLLWFGLALFAAPYVINEIKILRGIAAGSLPRYLIKKTVRNVSLMIEDFFMLGYYALSNFVVLVSTLYRMAVGKRLLEWKTYYNSQNSKEFSSYAREFGPYFAFITVICIGLAFMSFNAVFLGAYLLFAAVCYLELYFTSVAPLKNKEISEKDKELLRGYALKTYKYFKFMLSDGYIIADNLQIKPYKGASKTTSPTNIGFSMLAEICAYKLGFITLDECTHTLNRILDEIKKLPKWKGNLYNWYDVETLKPVNDFISSVDSGNFTAAVMVVKEFFKENNETIGELKAELTIANTDLGALFDRNKNLFYLGYDGKKFVGHYDLLNSESRILSTVYIALSGNSEHFRCLQRDYASYRGNTLLSWSGTAFEALMPDLLFASPKYSQLYYAALNNSFAQSETKCFGLWGISESGYFRFDEELRYQYYAFGLNKLALRNEKNKAVISPYASALCLNYVPKKVMENLSKLEDMGGLQEYGFYESLDCEGKPRFVSSFMSHHQGMLLCAITNFLCENELSRLLKNNLKIKATLNLYNELNPETAFGIKNAEKRNKIAISETSYSKNNNKIEQYLQATALTDTQYSVILNSYGGGISKNHDIYINRFYGVYEENDGAFFFVKEGEKWYSPTFLPLRGNVSDFSYSYTDNEILHANSKKNLIQRTTVLNGLSGEVRKLNVKERNLKVAFYMALALNNKDGYRSHPAFNGLFVEAIAEGNILVLLKKSQGESEKDKFVGVRVEGVKNLRWECNNENFIGRNRTLKDAIMLSENENTIKRTLNAPSLGDVLNPCIGFVGDIGEEECQVAIAYADDMKSLLYSLNALPDDMYSYALMSALKYSVNRFTNDILGEIIYLPYSQKLLNTVCDNGKRDYFIEKTRAQKLIIYNFSETNLNGFSDFLNVVKDLNVLRADVSFAVMVKDDMQRHVMDYINDKMRLYAVKNYDIFRENETITEFSFITLNADMSFNRNKIHKSKLFELENIRNEETDETIEHGSMLFRSGNGGFDENDNYIVAQPTALPYSNVISCAHGGTLTTDNGGGFFYFENSRENKASRFDNDCITDGASEFIFAVKNGCSHKINGGHGRNKFTAIERGKTTHVCKSDGLITAVSYYMICDGRARVISVDASDASGAGAEIVYGFFPALNWVYEPDFVTFEQKNDIITVKNLKNNQILYVKAIVENPNNLGMMKEREVAPYFEYFMEKEHEKMYFIFTQDQGLALSLNAQNIPLFEERSLSEFKSLANLSISSNDRSFNILTRYLPYQIASSRLRGKLGFYQVGGATGFRDQLQDCAAFLHSDSELVKNQILYSARHQYEEGDVMHWWHHPNFGLRSKITDDKLFLPLITAEYIKFSGDKEILNIELPYLSSPPLSAEENTRFENPPITEKREPLLNHCLKAIKSALKYGEHGLLIMGSGDWNDGMDFICSKGRGESVFNSMLCYEVITKFSEYCSEEIKKELNRIADELKYAVNTFAFENDRYKRLYSDDKRWLGSEKSDCLTLDLLVQSYAVISGIADSERANIVLDTAKKLIDRDAGIIKLLEPPLDKHNYLGYISAYPSGVRENGGQYTHAAMWYLIALTKVGRQDEAYELFQMLNPVEKCRDKKKNEMYKGEPYVLSGDVYSNNDNYGRMGWSWYTGSAAWAYRLIVEHFYGLKREGNELVIEPRLPKKLDRSVVTYNYGDSVYILEYGLDKVNSVEINGEDCRRNRISLEKGKRERVVVKTSSDEPLQ